MTHSHSEDRSTFYLEQVCTLGICGLLGAVTILLWQQDLLRYVLAAKFHQPVLWGGIALILLVFLRGLALVLESRNRTTNESRDHDHEHHDHGHNHETGHHHHVGHDHDHDCSDHEHTHDHEHCQASHEHDCSHAHSHEGHGHDHGLNPWRYIVLLLPIVLYFLGLPNAGLTVRGGSAADLEAGMRGKFVANTGLKIIKADDKDFVHVVGVAHASPAAKAGIKVRDRILECNGNPLKGKSAEDAARAIGGQPQEKVRLSIQHDGDEKPRSVEFERATDVLDLGFKELERGSYSPEARTYYEGRTVRLKGQFSRGADKRTFSLIRIMIKCCAADAIPLNVVIQLDPQAPGELGHFKPNDWVEVTGRVEYLKKKDQDEYVAVLNVAMPEDVAATQPDRNPYIQ
jgi:hypothetical protein